MANALPRDAEVGVIGAGAMGAGIAQIAAQAGHRVQLFDTRMGAADQAKVKIGETLAALAAKGQARRARTPTPPLRASSPGARARRSRQREARRRGDRRGPRRQAQAVARAGGRGGAGRDPRLQHVVAVDHGARRRDEAPGPRRRHAFLQSGAGAAAGRGGQRTRDAVRDGRRRVRDGEGVGQGAGARDVDAGLHRQPLRAAVLRRGAAPADRARGRSRDDRRGHARGRRVPHGPVRADGPDRTRRQPRGDARACGTPTSTIRASRRRSCSRSWSRPASSAASRAAASTTTTPNAPKPSPRTEAPQPRPARIRVAGDASS